MQPHLFFFTRIAINLEKKTAFGGVGKEIKGDKFLLAEPVSPSDFVGKSVRCGGTVEAVEINPNHSTLWISKLHISNAFAREMTPR